MTDLEFWETVVHTDVADVPRLRDRTAGQMLMKMAALAVATSEPVTLTVDFDPSLALRVRTPQGTYTFLADTTGALTVEQVL